MKTCSHCRNHFKARHRAAKYCSKACTSAARLLRDGFTCADCDKPMWRSSTSAPQGEARCRTCRNDGRGYYVTTDGRRVSHGVTGYSRGCRCETCSEVKAARMAEYFAKHRAEHGEDWSSTHRRKFRKKHGYWPQGSGFDFVPQDVRLAIYKRDNRTCQLCGTPVDKSATKSGARPTLDHIIPQSHGGPHTADNLRLAHGACNSRRSNRIEPELKARLALQAA